MLLPAFERVYLHTYINISSLHPSRYHKTGISVLFGSWGTYQLLSSGLLSTLKRWVLSSIPMGPWHGFSGFGGNEINLLLLFIIHFVKWVWRLLRFRFNQSPFQLRYQIILARYIYLPSAEGTIFFFPLSFYLFILPSFARGLRALLYCIVLNYKNLLKYMLNFSVAFT